MVGKSIAMMVGKSKAMKLSLRERCCYVCVETVKIQRWETYSLKLKERKKLNVKEL